MDILERFISITKVPRPSGHLDRIQDFLIDFAKGHDIGYDVDDHGNILMRRPGNTGYVALQGHQDMVASKLPNRTFDFTEQPIDVLIEGNRITADGTTLGADNGVGIAMMLNALESDDLKDVSLECLFTTDEEIGLLGAKGLKEDVLSSKYLINLDMENENKITIGCAGAANIVARFPNDGTVSDGPWWELKISGLLSGHSSMAGFGRANAIKLASGYLSGLSNVRLSSIDGGTFNNVIPMECRAVFSTTDTFQFSKFEMYKEEIAERYRDTDPGIIMELIPVEGSRHALSTVTTNGIISSLNGCPNDLFEKGDAGTMASSNLGIISTGDRIEVTSMMRGATDELIDRYSESIASAFRKNGADVTVDRMFPPWHEPEGSDLQRISTETYRDMFGRMPVIEITHGGLECGIIRNKCPDIQAIAVGPDMVGMHTPDETLDIDSLRRVERFVFELVKRLSE